jgi:hypothetical protein
MSEPAPPAPPAPSNGTMSLSTPWGSLAASGRDILMLAMLAALGAGVIGMQLYTFSTFTRTLEGARHSLDREVTRAIAERQDIVGLLRLRICTDVFLAEMASVKTDVRESVIAAWAKLCVPPMPE